MWGSIVLEQILQINFNFGFPTTHSDILIHLTHWQYWWWFWFTYFLTLYYILFLRLITTSTLKFNPKIVTSYRAHGKWGDFIICLVPISWCLNILTNSNFILRIIEWQMESSLFTVRVRGKQWYWVYKIEMKELLSVFNASKQLGLSQWVFFSKKSLKQNYSYLNLLQNKFNQINLENYWSLNFNSIKVNNFFKNQLILSFNKKNYQKLNSLAFLTQVNFVNLNPKLSTLIFDFNNFQQKKIFYFNEVNDHRTINNFLKKNFFLEINRFFKSNVSQVNQLKLFKDTIFVGNVTNKKLNNLHLYVVLKQKRSSLKKNIFLNNSNFYNYTKNSLTSEQLNVWNNLFLDNKINPELSKHVLNKRLLRVKRTLVLPTNVNITIITNSFDVIHSWYIPGLGIKLDCVPGRSTHHNVHIDKVGFYYGQCAEICGRYHHHMPIRVCALNFNHFLIWWSHWGLPKVFNSKINNLNYFNKNYFF